MPTDTALTTKAKPGTLNKLYHEAVARRDKTAFLVRGANGWEPVTWAGLDARVRKTALALLKLGLAPGERVAIFSNSRLEWVVADLAVALAGGVTVPIYQSVRDDEAGYILKDSGSRFVFVEDLDQWQKVRTARKRDGLTALEKAFIFDAAPTEKHKEVPFEDFVLTLPELEKHEGDADLLSERQGHATPESLLTLVYTSGTTGNPKGVMLTHGNAIAECEAIDTALALREDDVVLTFLPLAHIFARAIHWCGLKGGYTTAYTSIAKAGDDMAVVKPTCLPSVPRFFEKVFAGVMAKVEEESPLKRRYVKAAIRWNKAADKARRERSSLGLLGGLKHALSKPAVKKLSAKLKDRTGGRLRMFVSGGAALSKDVAEFFHSLGFVILEGYGLTETTAGTHVNRLDKYKLGTVGPCVPGMQCKLAEDGEILVRGPLIMKGYFNKDKETSEVFDKDGFFKTGDIGECDAEGYLRITDRKKDIIKTAGGKYIAPQKVEGALKQIHGVSQAVVIVERFVAKGQFEPMPYCTALVTLDMEAAKKVIREKTGSEPPSSPREIARHPAIEKHLADGLAAVNKGLPSWETIKHLRIACTKNEKGEESYADFEIGDELTPTLKVKRKRVAEKYSPVINDMYAQSKGGKE